MNTSGSVFEGVQKHKAPGNHRCMNDRGNLVAFQTPMRLYQAGHQLWQIVGARPDEMDNFAIAGNL